VKGRISNRAATAGLTAWILVASTGIALPERDVLVVVGGGISYPWDTEFEVANPEPAAATVEIGQLSVPLSEAICPNPFPCVISLAQLSIPANGSVRKRATEGIGAFFVSTLYVVPTSGTRLPVVRARVFDRVRPNRSADLPVLRRSTIAAMNPSVLVFPGATRSATARTNLVVAEVSGSGGIEFKVEAYSADGRRMGEERFEIGPGGPFGYSLFLVDLLARFQISSLDNGQIRVTKTGGTGLMWGLLATVSDDGGVTVSPGLNP
jgi:hypothetical protein